MLNMYFGEIIYSSIIETPNSKLQTVVDVSSLSDGIYTLRYFQVLKTL